MAKYRKNLPQLNDMLYLTDGGIETTLIFHEGFDLPLFAAFDLLKYAKGQQALYHYFARYASFASRNNVGFVLESPTWRASNGWGAQLHYSSEEIEAFNQHAIDLLRTVRAQYEHPDSPMPISGCIGPQDDGYNPAQQLTMLEAQAYHASQINTFRDTYADLVTAVTMTYVEEAIGIVWAAQDAEIPVVISFTVETDGKLPSGQSLRDAIEQVDFMTDHGPAYYMINCAHPTHFEHVLEGEDWVNRIRGVRANASCMSHAELDEAEELDEGNPEELGLQYHHLRSKLPNLNELGGCCGTDHRHVEHIYHACA